MKPDTQEQDLATHRRLAQVEPGGDRPYVVADDLGRVLHAPGRASGLLALYRTLSTARADLDGTLRFTHKDALKAVAEYSPSLRRPLQALLCHQWHLQRIEAIERAERRAA